MGDYTFLRQLRPPTGQRRVTGMTQASISAAVLIGGQSRRMGEPKALVRLADDGPTLLERTVETLRSVSGDVFLVGAADWLVPAPLGECPLVIDEGTSAADGVVTALGTAAHRFCVVVACDMPFLDAGLLREMGGLALRTGRGVIASDSRGAHPLHAVWDRDAAPALRDAIERNERSLGALARLANLAPLALDAAGRSDRDRWSAFNVNTPDDLAIARVHAAGAR